MHFYCIPWPKWGVKQFCLTFSLVHSFREAPRRTGYADYRGNDLLTLFSAYTNKKDHDLLTLFFAYTNSPGLSPERVRSSEQLLFAVSCSESCFLFEQSLIVAGCQGAPGQGHSPLFESRGSLFLKHFFELFFTQNCDCWQKTVPKWSQNEVMWSLFSRKNAKTKKCVSTAQACADCMWAHPMERPRRPQNQRKNITYFRTYFFP